MADSHPETFLEPELLERRLRELQQLWALGMALREVRLADEARRPRPDRVRERPDEP